MQIVYHGVGDGGFVLVNVSDFGRWILFSGILLSVADRSTGHSMWMDPQGYERVHVHLESRPPSGSSVEISATLLP
jgi:hypothetical protein